MDPTARFFTALRKMAVTLESETVKLQHAFENRDDDVDDDASAKASRAYHEVNCEVGVLKEQIQGQIAQQKREENEAAGFIEACRVLEQRVAKDIQGLRGHWGKYGYQAPRDPQRPTNPEAKDEPSEVKGEAAGEPKSSAGGEGENLEEDGGRCSSPPGPSPFPDTLRTPRLSDFGLSEVAMKRALAGWCSEVSPMPKLSRPPPFLSTPTPLTPTNPEAKDEPSEVKGEAAGEPKSSPGGEGENLEEDGGHRSSPPPFPDTLRTPRLSDFGLSEVAMKRAGGGWCSEVSPMPPFLSTPTPLTPKCALRMDDDEPQTHLMADFGLSERTAFLNNDFTMDLFRKNVEKPQRPPLVPPVNALARCLHTKAQNLESPEPPVFYTPGFKIKKPNRDRSPPAQSDGDPEFPDRHGNLPATPEAPVFQTPSMNRMATSGKNAPQPEPIDMDAEAHLHSPRSKRRWEEEVPDMSDLSSVTQDICKLVTKRTATAVVHPNVRPGAHPIRAVRLSEVSESEFQSLPKYLKQMTLLSLNRAVMNINMFTGESRGGQTEFRMEDLSRICVTGTKTPLYVLCLVELKRLQQTGGARGSSVYTLCN
ncbi:spindle and kinetochore-associated protein 3 [Cyclopterus lumpus]|uniref:Spindle and kinetochore-associated protein 3 n=1 Tax=Cyclopterus lumpus TaxID=8103 RepID=A0A8C2ZRW8_CYCLU|nr:spindle and kinetochore-associated protein 3 [Cyclopterus lumpus]